MPKYAILFMIFTLGALGLPGTSGFVGEFLILVGVFQKSIIIAILASLGVILSAVYMLWLYKRIIFGKIINNEIKSIKDLTKVELCILTSLAFLTLFFGFYPEPLINTVDVSINNLIENYKINLNFYSLKQNN
jgi:NADH-quinone oxidoreductase subunit M